MNIGQDLYRKAKKLIPGGTQLLSKRPEMFLPEQWPSYYAHAQGVDVIDLDGNAYVDMSIMGVGACIETFVLFKNGIVSMIIGAVPAEVTGPVGIAQLTGEVAKAGISPLLEFAAFISINFGIINLFPLPALDGGRIAFVLLEAVRRGKRIAPKTEGLVHLIGFALLIVFFLAITYQDIMRIVSGESIIP